MYLENLKTHPYGEPFKSPMGCCPGMGAERLNISTATRENTKFSRKYGWSVKAGGNYTSASDPQLARDVYEFQHQVQNCSGSLPSDFTQKTTDCYNRDGMIGQRTLQQMLNAANTPGDQWGILWANTINFPAGMVVRTPPDVACEDLSSAARANRPDCPGGGTSGDGTDGTGGGGGYKSGGKGGGSVMLWLGLAAVAAGGIYYYTKKK